jgi:potassium-dependent mechanosensitive channel
MFQQPSQTTIADGLIQKVLHYLNYPIVDQNEFKVSLMSIIVFSIVLAITTLIARSIRRVLLKRVLPRFNLGSGIQYTVVKLINYLVVTAGLLYGLKLGFAIDLTSIAVILGFLSVGIGFGLQHIASDIVAGLLLLFERPLRVGDFVKVESIEGRVERIGLRTTIVVTNDNIAVIVPNSKLANNSFVNWSHGSQEVRLRVPIGVAYGSDVGLVTDALVEAGRAVDGVMASRAPKVHLTDFGDSSINFELLIWIDRPQDHREIRSRTNIQIERFLRERQIQIPFPQRDLHLRSGSIRVDRGGLGDGAVNVSADV